MILGIDPGLGGALAFLGADGRLEVHDVPTYRAASRGREVDWSELARIVDAAGHVHHAFIERAAARPGQGTASMFKFGYVAGGLRGLVAAHFIPVTLVTPSTWKRVLAVPAGKDGARARASEILPRYAREWRRAQDHGRAEAALLAVYGAQMVGARARPGPSRCGPEPQLEAAGTR